MGKRDVDAELRWEIRKMLLEWFRLGYKDGREGILPQSISADETLHYFPEMDAKAERLFRLCSEAANRMYEKGYHKGRAERVSSEMRGPGGSRGGDSRV